MGKGQGTPTQPTSPQSAYSGSFGNYGGFSGLGGFGGFGQQGPTGFFGAQGQYNGMGPAHPMGTPTNWTPPTGTPGTIARLDMQGNLQGGPQSPMTQSQAMAQMPMGGQSLGSFGAQPQQAPPQNMQDAFQQFQQAQNLMGNLPGGQQPPMTQSQAMAQMPMGGQQNMQNAFQQFQQAQMPMSGQPQSAAPMGMMGNLQGGPQAPLSQAQMQQRAQMMAGAQQAFNPYNSGQYNQPGPQGGSFMQNLAGLGALPPRMPQAPMAQQIRQEDPRMQAMRNMQRMSGSGGRVEGINPNVRSV